MKIFIQLLLISAVISFASCKENAPKDGDPKDVCISDSLAKMISIDTVITSRIDDQLKLSGEISFDDNKVVKVFPFSSGQVLQVNVSLGDKVAKGQTLAIIKSADVAGNYADMATAGNDIAIAKKQLDNAESLYKNGIASEREYVEAKENYNKSLAASRKIQEQIAINGGGQTSPNGTYVVKAPMSGYVVEKKIGQGSFIRSDFNDNLFTVGDISDVWVWANVYESDIAKVKEGYTAKVTTLAYPDSTFNGVVDKISQQLDPETKVMKIRVRLPNSGLLLKPEMFANILIENKQGAQAITIPRTAVISDNGKNYVIVYHGKCDLAIREVQVLRTVGNSTYLSGGAVPGELIISRNQVLLFNALREN
ncbi:efflux RND transporter periplasmic adaptor subunit [Pseudoflavitalea sp. G-6-1-2]|uniref:efflux RND transporter periplasmic adaptor subunit n=1 Tax=Pseudoflavitalea sp. G-6-1-2 TaxID=2728841 RepID=UPI00146DA8ED|nr:efflux RND transporter periplasmic adaptor subunit [Pseudoflavitalea sp. G-6-1-2]NML23411.1 efflux RND transporter periplasmic adaptor subunit [Pseudoflavitalea sp. G-6-1-2]